MLGRRRHAAVTATGATNPKKDTASKQGRERPRAMALVFFASAAPSTQLVAPRLVSLGGRRRARAEILKLCIAPCVRV